MLNFNTFTFLNKLKQYKKYNYCFVKMKLMHESSKASDVTWVYISMHPVMVV